MKGGERFMGAGLKVLGHVAASPLLDRLGMRGVAEELVRDSVRGGFRTAGVMGRSFRAARRLARPLRVLSAHPAELFDPRPDEEQQLLTDAVRSFALERLRPAALEADTQCVATPELLETAAELGAAALNVPEALGGAAGERSAVSNVLITEALAQGDAGLAVACLAPVAVATALALWGSAEQQASYLPSFVAEHAPAAALAILEPHPLFDPFALRTTARRSGNGFLLSGTKTLVPLGASAELFLVAADLQGQGPRLFVVESKTAGLSYTAEPAMGLRAAATTRLEFKRMALPASALVDAHQAADVTSTYAQCVQLARVGWCALAVGVAQAALDYVAPYVNERTAFGEPISHRQGVAFAVADMAIELDAMRLLTHRAASRAEHGLAFAREAALARRLCADKGAQIGSMAIQLLGGHGFVKEHPVERWYRDLRAVGLMEGVLLV
ncbi:MAG TPA: acyl-CoA dehydrogenase family protein [Nevskiaceae bacterium]|nr:acyl-CoA dehydrogenase family protein [Nevskiaceae bacterium]